jgi:hypothetical protein
MCTSMWKTKSPQFAPLKKTGHFGTAIAPRRLGDTIEAFFWAEQPVVPVVKTGSTGGDRWYRWNTDTTGRLRGRRKNRGRGSHEQKQKQKVSHASARTRAHEEVATWRLARKRREAAGAEEKRPRRSWHVGGARRCHAEEKRPRGGWRTSGARRRGWRSDCAAAGGTGAPRRMEKRVRGSRGRRESTGRALKRQLAAQRRESSGGWRESSGEVGRASRGEWKRNPSSLIPC